MSDALATRLSLLVRLRDARDDGAWAQFVELYAPLVFGFARQHGLQDADAADLTQDVLQAVSAAIEGKTGPQVAKTLGLSVAAVYLAKGRVMERLKQLIRDTLGEPD